jgi:hypothetical protein
LRALAFAMVEGSTRAYGEPEWLAAPDGAVHFVDVGEFDRRAAPADVGLRSDQTEPHTRDRVVACEPRPDATAVPQRSRYLSGPLDGQAQLLFSRSAGTLMAERARGTAPLLQKLATELAEHELPITVKLLASDDKGERLFRWFQVLGFADDGVDAVPLRRSAPVLAARHAYAALTDWAIHTPFGLIMPRTLHLMRVIREQPDELRAAMAELRRRQ